MKKTLLTSSIALTLSITSTQANAAFTPLTAGNYTMEITSGCTVLGQNCQTSGNGIYSDNTATQASTTVTSDTLTSRPTGSTIGSGIAGDGLMGVINFSLDTSGNISVSSFNQDSKPFTSGGTLFYDAFGINGTSAMTGNIANDGTMTFTPTGREGMFEAFATDLGVQPFYQDKLSGLYDTFTTGTSTNRPKGGSAAFTMTGAKLTDVNLGGWVGTLVSAGNMNGDDLTGFDNVQYSELWNVSIKSAPAVPIPAAAWLFGSGLLGLVGVARRKHRKLPNVL